MIKLLGKSLRKSRTITYAQIISPQNCSLSQKKKRIPLMWRSLMGVILTSWTSHLNEFNATNNKKYQYHVFPGMIHGEETLLLWCSCKNI